MIVALAIAAAMGGGTSEADVVMSGRRYTPADITVVAGSRVRWRNDDREDHTVRGEGVDSGLVPAGATFSHTWQVPGRYEYFCSIHRTMRGAVSVVALGLSGPRSPVAVGDTVTLEALAPAGTPEVTLERLDRTVANPTATPDDDGRARFTFTVEGPARYRVRAGSMASAPVTVRVAAAVTASVVRRGRSVHVEAAVSPERPGGTVVLERYVRERFDWLPLRRARWRGGSDPIEFALRSRRSLRLRVRVPAAAGGWASSVSSGSRPRSGHH